MERRGHYGTTLLLSTIIILTVGLLHGLAATALMMLFTPLPDQDQAIPDSIVSHRGATHSLTFSLVVAFVVASTAAYPTHIAQKVVVDYGLLPTRVVSPADVWLFFGGSVTLSLIGHVATDLLTTGGGYKVEPLWPLSSRQVALGLCNSDDIEWNTGLFVAGGTAFLAATVHELYYTVVPAVL
jgi:membrane-bound metal-dependent hydrolase YbcI (DUF457 family)